VRGVGRHTLLAAIVLTFLVLGGLAHALVGERLAHLTWAVADLLVLVPLTWGVARSLRRGQVGVDVIALLAIAGALIAGEYLAGAVIALMLSGGNALEEYARGRAGRELSSLVARAPREAHVRRAGSIVEVAAGDVVVGDVVVIRAGEIVPVDGHVTSGEAVLDQAALTGEPLPVTIDRGGAVLSGSANAGSSFEMVAQRTADDSMYASIVDLVEQAVARRAPMVRLADRYSVIFLVATLVVTVAAWLFSGEAIRALAVLVIATPCPLILAPPVALVAGTSRAARRGVIVKGSAAIEALGRVRTVLIDKTGTVTLGTPSLQRVVPVAGIDEPELLRCAAAIEQLSVHGLAEAIAHAGLARFGSLPVPEAVVEHPGHGLSGTVEGRRVAVGSADYLRGEGIDVVGVHGGDGIAAVCVALDGAFAGTIELADTIRDDAAGLAGALRAAGVERIAMATGDHGAAAARIASQLDIEEVYADCTAARKLELLTSMRQQGRGGTVVMVGDGVNDAPALAAADVGIAMGSAGATAASEAAEAVIVSGRILAVAEAIGIGRRSTRIALQSVIAGMGLSCIGMLVAALGYLPPVYGALAQEAIDLAVILNALRALAPSRAERA
jgi:heavy metal translocating P-type ATPase